MTTRLAAAADVPALVALINRAYEVELSFVHGERTSAADVRARMAQTGAAFLVAEDARGMAGAVFARVRGDRGFFAMLAVHPDRQKQGLKRPAHLVLMTKALQVAAFVSLAMLAACRQVPPPAEAPAAAPAVDAEAPVTEPGATWDPWADAESRGIDFRAVGNEPGWYLEVDDERWMRMLYAYGERQATVPAVQPVTRGDVTTFDSSGDGHRVRADITPGPCSDGMSDLTYPLNVSVTVDGMTFRGCGRWLQRKPAADSGQ